MLAAIGSAVNANVEENENLQSIRFLSGSKSIQIESATDESLVHHAKIASQADIVLLADNVADGPMPIHREHVILTRQMGVPQAMILLTNCDLVGDPELLELVELEVRELLNNFGLPGDEAQCVLDQERAKTSSKSRIGKGPKEIVRLLTESAARRIPIPASEPTHLFSAEVYALARVEAPQGAMTISTGPLSIIMGGNVVQRSIGLESQRPNESGQRRTVLDSKSGPPGWRGRRY
jgi:translation elongation factor EF-Tu-like GTPase